MWQGTKEKSGAAGQTGQGDGGEDRAGATTDPGLRRDQAGPLAATDYSEERGYSQTVKWAISTSSALQHSPPSHTHPKAFTEHLPIPDPPLSTVHWTVGKSLSPLNPVSPVDLKNRTMLWLLLSTPALRLSLGSVTGHLPLKVSWTQTLGLLVLTIAVTCTDSPRLRHLL